VGSILFGGSTVWDQTLEDPDAMIVYTAEIETWTLTDRA
jgi:hypothetical protein